MHEASLVQGLLDMCLTAVREHNAAHPEAPVTRVEEVRCQLGLLSCVEPQTLTACFELFTEDTPAAGARLVLETAPPLPDLRPRLYPDATALYLPPLRWRKHPLRRRPRTDPPGPARRRRGTGP